MKRAAVAATLCLVAVTAGDPATAATVLRPTADFYVTALHPERNYGAATRLVMTRRPASRAYVRFQPGRPPPRGGHVLLYLYPLRASAAGLTLRHASDRPWNERRLTLRTAPRTGPHALRSGPLRAGRWKAIDVTRLVNGSGIVGLGMSANGRDRVEVASREVRARAPRLLILEPGAHVPVVPPAAPGETVPPEGADATPPTPLPAADTCGSAPAPPVWQHVVWIVMENKDYSQIIGSSDAPYINALASACGVATAFHAEAHPSLPNYIAMTSGDTQGIHDDAGPTSHPLDVPSIFSQLGDEWRALQESMPLNCAASNSSGYAVRHNPAVYYTNLAASCLQNDIPLTDPPNLSGRFTFVTPNLCNDMHSCNVAAGDRWLSRFMPQLLESPDYRAGTMAVFLTWDEDDNGDNHIATLVVSPSTPPGTADPIAYDHYSMLRTTEEMLGLPLLGNAALAGSMRPGFGL